MMDIENDRKRKSTDFVESIGLVYCEKWKNFMRELGIEVTDELKLVKVEDWITHLDSLSIPKIKILKLKVALDCLSDTGPIEVS